MFLFSGFYFRMYYLFLFIYFFLFFVFFLFIHWFIYLFIYLWIYLCIFFWFIYLFIDLFVCLFVCLFVFLMYLFVYLSVCLLVYLTICLFLNFSISLFFYFSIYLFIYLSLYLFISLFLDLFNSLFLIYLCVYLYIHLNIYLLIFERYNHEKNARFDDMSHQYSQQPCDHFDLIQIAVKWVSISKLPVAVTRYIQCPHSHVEAIEIGGAGLCAGRAGAVDSTPWPLLPIYYLQRVLGLYMFWTNIYIYISQSLEWTKVIPNLIQWSWIWQWHPFWQVFRCTAIFCGSIWNDILGPESLKSGLKSWVKCHLPNPASLQILDRHGSTPTFFVPTAEACDECGTERDGIVASHMVETLQLTMVRIHCQLDTSTVGRHLQATVCS